MSVSRASTPPASAADLASDRGSRAATVGDQNVTLCWRNLTVEVDKKVHKKSFFSKQQYERQVILDNISGYARSGKLTAIMGASGAGKTTLLATISQRVKIKTRGDVVLNGQPASAKLMTRLSGFVPQLDLVYKSLLVIEHMEFMARLMMDQRVRKIHRNRRIYCLLSELGLLGCLRTQLGNLSGGEMKRLSLAVQLLTDPPFLFCDEPTTGLDSYSAGVVLEHLRHCAERGKSIICTIHQPASGHFDLFHDVMLLADGRVAYFGAVRDAFAYFNSVGIVCPPTYNPPEFYVQQLAIFPGKEKECHSRNQWLCDAFLKSPSGQEVADAVNDEFYKGQNGGMQRARFLHGSWSTHSSTTTESLADTDIDPKFINFLSIVRPNHYTQFKWLVWRTFKGDCRNGGDQVLRLFLFMLVGVMISSPYIYVTKKFTQSTIQNLGGFLYLINTETVFTFAYSVFHTFPAEIPIFLREISNGLYSTAPYYVSKMLILLVKAGLEAFLYAIFIFYVADLQGGLEGCLLMCMAVVFSALAATAYGTLISAAFDSTTTACLLSVPIELISLSFSGIFLQLSTLPSYLSWIKYISQFYYGQEAISITQWSTVDSIACPEDPTLPCISDGEGVLNKYGYNKNNYALDLTGLASIYFAAHLVGCLCLWKRSRRQAIY